MRAARRAFADFPSASIYMRVDDAAARRGENLTSGAGYAHLARLVFHFVFNFFDHLALKLSGKHPRLGAVLGAQLDDTRRQRRYAKISNQS